MPLHGGFRESACRGWQALFFYGDVRGSPLIIIWGLTQMAGNNINHYSLRIASEIVRSDAIRLQ